MWISFISVYFGYEKRIVKEILWPFSLLLLYSLLRFSKKKQNVINNTYILLFRAVIREYFSSWLKFKEKNPLLWLLFELNNIINKLQFNFALILRNFFNITCQTKKKEWDQMQTNGKMIFQRFTTIQRLQNQQ